MVRSRVDYATDQITVYRYCPFACRYCYVWRNKLFASRVQRGKYNPVEEAKNYIGKKNRVIVVSFVSDPYPPEERIKRLARSVLEVLCNTDNKVLVLTKNPQLALRDIDMMGSNCWLGTTVITLDKSKWRYWEPGTLYSPSRRLWALRVAYELGIKTWLSIEPIIPGTTYPQNIVRKAIDYVDFFVLGSFNYPGWLGYTTYSRNLLEEWYRRHVVKAIEFLKSDGKLFHIKKELGPFLEQGDKTLR